MSIVTRLLVIDFAVTGPAFNGFRVEAQDICHLFHGEKLCVSINGHLQFPSFRAVLFHNQIYKKCAIMMGNPRDDFFKSISNRYQNIFLQIVLEFSINVHLIKSFVQNPKHFTSDFPKSPSLRGEIGIIILKKSIVST
jgi:hypothetical protein